MNRDEKRGIGRRALIKWSVAVGAAMGLPRWKVFEALELSGGRALAEDASCAPTNRSVHIVAGDGGFAWFQLLWPHNDVAAAGDDRFAWHAIGEHTMAEGTHRPLTLGPEAPWRSLGGARQVTCLMAGSNETHTRRPASSSSVSMNTGLFAACAALQTSNPTLVPVIAVDDVPYRDAQGAPRVARVGSADDIVSLFNSAASRAGGLLRSSENAELFSATYSAFLSMRPGTGRPTVRAGYASANTAARLLGRNLAEHLRPTEADFARYGIDGGSRARNRDLAKGLIVTAKAFSMGLTSSVILPAFRDDPHGAFNDMAALRKNVGDLGRSLDAFVADLAAMDDATCAGSSIADNTVISIHGDTPKDPLRRNNWPDGTPSDSNWLYVLSAGQLKTGWFGGVRRDGTVNGWNPTSGEEAAGMASDTTANAAAAAVAYAVSKGDLRRVADFYRGVSIRGVIASETT